MVYLTSRLIFLKSVWVAKQFKPPQRIQTRLFLGSASIESILDTKQCKMLMKRKLGALLGVFFTVGIPIFAVPVLTPQSPTQDLMDDAGVAGYLDEDEDLLKLAGRAATQLVKSLLAQEILRLFWLIPWTFYGGLWKAQKTICRPRFCLLVGLFI